MPSFRSTLFVVGLLLLALAVAMLVPAAVDGAVGNANWIAFAVSSGITAVIGVIFTVGARSPTYRIRIREAFLITAITWTALALFAALPFMFLDSGISVADAVFEAMSGLTTTGSTVMVGLDGMPPGILLWRSILQWIGGVGIIVMAIMILPFLRVGGMQLFRTESSDRSEKIVSRPIHLAVWIGTVYLSLTAVCALAYGIAGMSPFDALNHAMTTLATGGYSTHDASFNHFPQPAIHWIGTLFMATGALPFVLYIKSLKGHWLALLRDQQVRGFFVLLTAAVAGLTAWLWLDDMPLLNALRQAAFNVTSIITTTGFANADYGAWGALPAGIFLLLTFMGGCTGSTSGGIKMFRHQIIMLMTREQLSRLVFPRIVFARRYNGGRVSDDIVPSVVAFLAAYLIATAAIAVGLTAFGLDLITSFSGAATAISNVGPGLGPIIGPAGNFAALPDGAKWLLSFGMLLGRLELFTVLVILTPAFWRA
jgi:trk system potassium uptake protein TrkH